MNWLGNVIFVWSLNGSRPRKVNEKLTYLLVGGARSDFGEAVDTVLGEKPGSERCERAIAQTVGAAVADVPKAALHEVTHRSIIRVRKRRVTGLSIAKPRVYGGDTVRECIGRNRADGGLR